MLTAWFEAVAQFCTTITRRPVPDTVQPLKGEGLLYAVGHLQEELDELKAATSEVDQIDALLDLIYVALGTMFHMGVKPGPVFAEVQRANMEKESASTDRTPYDAVKPEGWTAPRLEVLLQEIMDPGVALFRECQIKKAQRGQKYNSANSAVTPEAYHPFGHESYAQMIWVKALRYRVTHEQRHNMPHAEYLAELAEHLVDMGNYMAFHFDFLMEDAKNHKALATVREKLNQ